jgi:hypothetical protein
LLRAAFTLCHSILPCYVTVTLWPGETVFGLTTMRAATSTVMLTLVPLWVLLEVWECRNGWRTNPRHRGRSKEIPLTMIASSLAK